MSTTKEEVMVGTFSTTSLYDTAGHDSKKSHVIISPSCPDLTADDLVLQVERVVKRETNFGVREMSVDINDGKIILSGYCRTFYTKQLAQQAALQFVDKSDLINEIRVASL